MLHSFFVNNFCTSGKWVSMHFIAQESVVLAKWLMGICVAVFAQHPDDEHAGLLGKGGLAGLAVPNE